MDPDTVNVAILLNLNRTYTHTYIPDRVAASRVILKAHLNEVHVKNINCVVMHPAVLI